jgi:hypothetical protein
MLLYAGKQLRLFFWYGALKLSWPGLQKFKGLKIDEVQGEQSEVWRMVQVYSEPYFAKFDKVIRNFQPFARAIKN